MAQYDYEVFKACNDKHKGYGHASVKIEFVDMKLGLCQLVQYGFDNTVNSERLTIEELVKRYITFKSGLPYIANPSKIKAWKGFNKFDLDNKDAFNKIDDMLIGIKEQYTDIVEGIGAVKRGLTFELKRKGNKVVFSGMMSSEIPFKVKEFSIMNKDMAALRDEIKSYLFDTLDGIVNIC